MKQFMFVCLLVIVLISCRYKTHYEDTKVKYVIDSVEYHPIGYDNTLQTTPYWKLHLNNREYKIVSHRHYQKGDTIEVIERKIKN